MKSLAPVLAALLALAPAMLDCSAAPPANAPLVGRVTTTAAVVPRTTQTALRDQLRTVFLDRATWFRLCLIDAAYGAPDLAPPTQRFMQSATAIGAAFAPYYGPSAAAYLTSVLQDETVQARSAVSAAIARDDSGFARARDAWHVDADRVASFFAHANPSLSQAGLAVTLRASVDDAIDQIHARLAGDWTRDVAAADASDGHALAIADVLTDGTAQRYPDAVARPQLDPRAESIHLVMRDLFYSRATRMHELIVARVGGMQNADLVGRRLMQNQTEISKVIAVLYGRDTSGDLTTLLRADVAAAMSAIGATAGKNDTDFEAAKAVWYVNADRLVTFLAEQNPQWRFAELDDGFRALIDDALDDTKARIDLDWKGSTFAADALRSQSVRIADVISTGAIAQLAL